MQQTAHATLRRTLAAALLAIGTAHADPVSYPTSDAEYAALKARAHVPQPHGWAGLPDWSGVWEAANRNSFDGVSNFITEPSPAPLSPAYARRYAATRANMQRGIFYDQTTACLPAGFPRMQVEPYSKEWIVTPGRVMLMAELNNETRRIYTDGRKHMSDDDAYPLWDGDSIGFWDGQTLVVHTTHLRADDQAYQREGPPQSDQISTVERIHRTGDRIADTMTVYDPIGLAHPWHVTHQFRRVTEPDARIDQWACEENNNYIATPNGGTTFVGHPSPGVPR